MANEDTSSSNGNINSVVRNGDKTSSVELKNGKDNVISTSNGDTVEVPTKPNEQDSILNEHDLALKMSSLLSDTNALQSAISKMQRSSTKKAESISSQQVCDDMSAVESSDDEDDDTLVDDSTCSINESVG